MALLRARVLMCGLSEVDDDGGSERRERYSLFYLFFFIGLSLLLPLSFFLDL